MYSILGTQDRRRAMIGSNTEFLDADIQACNMCKLGSLPVNKEFGKLTGFGEGYRFFMVAINPGRNRKSFGGHGVYPDDSFAETQDGLIARAFSEVGLPWRDFYVTNLVKCSTEDNEMPSRGYVDLCTKTFLYQEFITARCPQIIVCLGNFVYEWITENKKMFGSPKIHRVYHHSHIMRSGGSKSQQYADWKKQLTQLKVEGY
jgi:uracil-DNA glycosylase family 4